MLTTIEITSHLMPELVLYSGKPALTHKLIVQEADLVVIEVTADSADAKYDVAYGTPFHPAITDRGVYAEFFLENQDGTRHWETGSLIGLTEDPDDSWYVTVGERAPGSFIVVFSYTSH